MRDEQEAIHAALQEHAGLPDGAVLTAWALVAEFIGPDGERYPVKFTGPEGTSAWLHEGLLHHGLYGDWSHQDDDEDDES